MSSRKPRWEIVHTDAGWHVRFVSSNGKVIVSSEVYRRRTATLRAIRLVTGHEPYDVAGYWFISTRLGVIEVRDLDHRTATP